mgnify:FL=1
MSRPETALSMTAIAAAQAISLDLLRAEMAALAMMLPGKDAPEDTSTAEAREARLAEAFEDAFDDVPV